MDALLRKKKPLCVSAFLGNLFEHYDTALWGFLSPFLAPLIFPQKDPITALVISYGMIPLGMLARPIGSLFFGYLGDFFGRGQAFSLTLFGMAALSCLISLTPLYSEIGAMSSLIFCLARVLQNFFSAGETIGGAIFVLERSDKKKHDFVSGLYGASSLGGILLASFGVYLFASKIDPGWRALYLLGGLTAFFGMMIRLKEPQLKKAKNSLNQPSSFAKTVITLVSENRFSFFAIFIASGFSHASYNTSLVLFNGLMPLIAKVSHADMIKMNTYLLLLDFALLLFFGYAASKVSRKKLMFFSSFIAAVFSYPCFFLLQDASFSLIFIIRAFFVLLGALFSAPFYSWAQSLIPQKGRYTLISLSYALGSQLLGSPAAMLGILSFQKTGSIFFPAFYYSFLALGAGFMIWQKTSEVSTSSMG